jgi:hypothetical protein
MTSRAEALVAFTAKPRDEALAVLVQKSNISFEVRSGGVRLLAVSEGAPIEAMTAAALAALALIDAMKDSGAVIESVRLVEDARPQQTFVSRGALSKEGARPKPQTLMNEVSAPRPAPDNAREAFRNFMTAHRLRPTTWAKEAGVPSGEILGYLTGRSRGFSPATAEKLARAAKCRVEDMFK